MRPFLLLLLLAAAFSMGCNSSGAEQQAAPPPISEPENDDLTLRLSTELVNQPGNLAEEEQNKIIGYAIDHNLDVQKAPEGYWYMIRKPGEGDLLQWGDRIRAHYQGRFLDDATFDDSYRRKEPLEFYIGNMIEAWNEALQKLKPGGKMLLLVPSSLAYGEKGLPMKGDQFLVPPDTPLLFEIEVLALLQKAPEN